MIWYNPHCDEIFSKILYSSYILIFPCLYYPVKTTTNKSKEKFKIVFCSFLAIKNIVAPSFSSNFPVKLIFEEQSYLFSSVKWTDVGHIMIETW